MSAPSPVDYKQIGMSMLVGGVTGALFYWVVDFGDTAVLGGMIPAGVATVFVSSAIATYAGPKLTGMLNMSY